MPVGQRHEHRADPRLQGAGHDPRRLLADAAARRHDRPGAGAVADERRQPLHRARRPGPNNAPALAGGRRRCPRAPRAKSSISTSCSTRSTRRRARACRRFIQGSAEQYAGASRALGTSAEYFAAVARGDRPLLRRARSATSRRSRASSSKPPRRSPRSARAGTAHRPDRKRQHDLPGDRLAAGDPRPGAARAAGHAATRATARSRNCPSTFAALTQLVEASKPTTKPLDDALRAPALAAHHGARRSSTTSASRSAGPDRTTTSPTAPRAARARQELLATARRATVTALKESVPITAFFGPYTPDLEGTLRTFGQAAAYYDANGHYARVSPVFPDFTLGANNTLTPATPQQALARPARPASCAAARARRPSPPPTAPRRSPTANCSAATRRRCPDEPAPRRLARRQPAADRRGHDADRGRGRVPLLQRQQRAAVRAHLQHQGRTARGLGAADLQPGADRAARASGSSTR